MRFSDRVTIVSVIGGGYNPDAGFHDESETVKHTLPCKLSAMGLNRRKELFGELDEGVTIARLQRPHKGNVDYVEVDGKRYEVTQQSNYRKGVLFLVGDTFAN